MATSVEVPQAPSVTPPTRLTAEAFYDMPQPEDGSAELVDGVVVVSPFAGGPHGRIGRNIFLALHAHVDARGLGEAFFDGTGFALPHRDDSVRGPDVSFVAAGRLPTDALPRGWVRLAPDLAVEILSPTERYSALRKKLDDYFAAGTRLAWVVDPDRWGVEIHLPDRSLRWVPGDAVLDGAPLLPDFRLPVADIFRGAVPRP